MIKTKDEMKRYIRQDKRMNGIELGEAVRELQSDTR